MRVGCKGVRAGCEGMGLQGLLADLNGDNPDDSNGLSRLKIRPLLRKLWAKTFQSLKTLG